MKTPRYGTISIEDASEVNNNSESENVRLPMTAGILRIVVSLFYGMVPRTLSRSRWKTYLRCLPLCVAIYQWLAVAGYVYCTCRFWMGKIEPSSRNNTVQNKSVVQHFKLPKIPVETLLILLGLVISGAVTVTLFVAYFYKEVNHFMDESEVELELLTKVASGIDFIEREEVVNGVKLDRNNWLLTIALLVLGLALVLFALISNLVTGTLFDFHGIRDFLATASMANKLIYYTSVSGMFWGFGCTVCACCIFHLMCRKLVIFLHQIKIVLSEADATRKQFFKYHEVLLQYTETMIAKFKYWFAVHNLMFVFLVAAIIYGWITSLRRLNFKHHFIINQVADTLLICYQFSFPFISASLVTVEFKQFYIALARENRYDNVPELPFFSQQFGFNVFGFIVTPNVAIFAFSSSLIGVLKLLSA